MKKKYEDKSDHIMQPWFVSFSGVHSFVAQYGEAISGLR